MNKHN